MKTLVVDGTYLMYRSFHQKGVWNLRYGGLRTGGAFSVLRSLHQSFDRLNDLWKIVVVWDGSRSKRRIELYPEYKANRASKYETVDPLTMEPIDLKDELKSQRVIVEEFFKILGIRVASIDREGDDVVYWLSRLAGHSVILSEDKDMLTMVTPSVDVYRPFSDEHWSHDLFEREHGFSPKEYLYFKAIVGDASDNIPGVKGAGEATATTFCKAMYEFNLAEALKQSAEGKNARLKKIPEQFGVVTGNLALMDCSYEVLTAEEREALSNSLFSQQTKGNYQEFHELCAKYGFHSLQSESWYSQFMWIN